MNQHIFVQVATCQCFPPIRSTQVSIRSLNLRIADVNPGKDLVEMLCWEAVESAAVGQQLVELLYGRLGVWYGDFQWYLRGAEMFLHASVLLQKQKKIQQVSSDEDVTAFGSPAFYFPPHSLFLACFPERTLARPLFRRQTDTPGTRPPAV